MNIFLISPEKYVVGLVASNKYPKHICFRGEIRKYQYFLTEISGATIKDIFFSKLFTSQLLCLTLILLFVYNYTLR